jgi:DNA polymerase-3 subunit beta
LKPISIVAGVVERRLTLPILSYILIKATDVAISFTGTDLEVEIVATTEGEVEKVGEVTVPARKLFDILRALPENLPVTLSRQGEKVTVKAGKSRFSLSTLPAGDFPKVEARDFERALTIDRGELRKVIERTAFCMAQQDVRYYLNGLYMEIQGRHVRGVATDGHRMAITETNALSEDAAAAQVILPRKGVQEISRLLTEGEAPISLQIGVNHVRLSVGSLVLTSKLIDGKFPDYTKVIPSNQSKHVSLNRQAFREALARVSILANEKYRGIRLNLESGRLLMSANNPEQEEAVEEIDTPYSGDALEIGFNVNYLIDATNAIGSPNVILGLSDPNSSCTLMASDDESTKYIVMPMRL